MKKSNEIKIEIQEQALKAVIIAANEQLGGGL